MNKRKKHGGVSHRLTQMKHRSERNAFLICENLCSSVAQSKWSPIPDYFSLFCIRLNQRNQRFSFSGTTEQMASEKDPRNMRRIWLIASRLTQIDLRCLIEIGIRVKSA